MTSDLAQVLRISEQTAESVKCLIGLSGVSSEQMVPDLDGNLIHLPTERARYVLRSRVSELLELIRKETGPFFGLARTGCIFTGGGSALSGLLPFVSDNYKLPVKVAEAEIPASSLRLNDTHLTASRPEERVRMSSPYSTACGILYLAVRDLIKDGEKPGLFQSRRYLKAIVNWIKELT